ncbi:MAG: site-specific DNA-methyltransferase [Prevotellaceae bacterium]|jgi:site-specific DNA-methyltransferase (adenine-specific)|nr:site-specific DNA-methyltransferase [Prevotellaceae bacterium]
MIEANRIYNEDCLLGMQRIDDASVDVILTDPPYLYLKNQKLDRPFNEQRFFSEAKRVLKPDGFIVLFGRGTSFYRWNTMLADLEFTFKEEIIWNKSYSSSPLMNISRIHETVSIHTKKNGTINKVKIPYLEMKGHDIDAIVTDIKRLKSALKNTKSLDAVLSFLENNKVPMDGDNVLSTSISSVIGTQNRCVAAMRGIQNGMNEKSIIRTDFTYSRNTFKHLLTGNNESAGAGKREINVVQSMVFGYNEKSIIKQGRDHYTTIHPTQKPVRLLERLLALVTKEGDTVLDPFSGSASTAIAAWNTNRNFIGFEIDKEYYNASVERLNKILATTKQQKIAI